jgi:drug/metabolite transporter (DMT)-like permease
VAAVVLALGSSLAWGVADFVGGLKSRTLAVPVVLLVSQAVGLVAIALVVVATGEDWPGLGAVLPAVLGGTAGLVGLAAFYRGLAVGAMGVVAPISSAAAVVPVVVGLVGGERPSSGQVLGTVLAVVGVAVAAREVAEADPGAAPAGPRLAKGVPLALVAALGFGTFFVGLDAASESSVLWAILASRLFSVLLLVGVALAVRTRLPGPGPDLSALVVVGVFDVAANTMFAYASTAGLLSVVGVLGALYPVVTVLLARLVLGERLAVVQRAGAAVAVAGVAVIAAT